MTATLTSSEQTRRFYSNYGNLIWAAEHFAANYAQIYTASIYICTRTARDVESKTVHQLSIHLIHAPEM